MSQPNKSGPVSKVELRVECTGLKKKDEFSKSDPCAVLYMQQRGTNSWNEVQPLLVSSTVVMKVQCTFLTRMMFY